MWGEHQILLSINYAILTVRRVGKRIMLCATDEYREVLLKKKPWQWADGPPVSMAATESILPGVRWVYDFWRLKPNTTSVITFV